MRDDLTQARLHELLTYDSLTGEMCWRVRTSNRVKVGDIAGAQHIQGYVHIAVDGYLYLRHRLIWLYVHGRWPAHEIDHINGKRDDDRLCNLREATAAQNNANKPARGRLGVKGVRPAPCGPGFCARITVKGRGYHLGTYPTAEEASAVYNHIARVIHGEYAYAEPQQ